MKKVHTNKGFTLAELLIVVAVIAVLVAVAIPTFANQLEKSRQAVDVSNLRGAFAAARLAQMEGSVNGVKFKDNQVQMAKGQSKPNDVSGVGTGSEKYYASYWYDPDSGKLFAVNTEPDESDPTVLVLSDQYATAVFKNKSQLGKAQGMQVLADTSQLPGEGAKLVVYKTEQLIGMSDYDSTTADKKEEIQSGTLDRAIRVTFYKTIAGPWKVHEIRFVANANEGLVNEGAEDELVILLADGVTDYEVEAEKNEGSVEIDLEKTITINGKAFSKEKYDVSVADKANAFLNTPSDGETAVTTLKYDAGKISGILHTDSTTPANSKDTGTITVTITDKGDATVSGTFEFTVNRKTE